MSSYLCFHSPHNVSPVVFPHCHPEWPHPKCLNKAPTKYERWGKLKKRHNGQRLIYHVFLQGTVEKPVWCVWIYGSALSCIFSLLFHPLFHPVTAPENSYSSDVRVVSKKSESTVLYSKGLYPSGLCVFAAVLVLFICLSQVLLCSPRRYQR